MSRLVGAKFYPHTPILSINSTPKSTYRFGNSIFLGIKVGRCEVCGAEVELPFQCNYCKKYFCEAHRLLENHNCPNAPPRTPLGSYQAKQMLASTGRRREVKTAIENMSLRVGGKTKTYGNRFHHHFDVPVEVYSDEGYRKRLNHAKTMNEADHIVHDYYKHHRKDIER